MLKSKLQVFLAAALLSSLIGLTGCGGGGGAAGSASTSTTPSTPPAAAVLLGSSSASIKPDGTNSTTLTATVVDANNLPVSGATVKFTASAGTLGVSSGVSTKDGVVTIGYSATGISDMSDHSETLTATVVGTAISARIPVKVSSSSLVISLGTSNATVNSDGSNSATITATVTDPNNIAVSGQTVTFTKGTGQLGTSSGTSSGAGTVTIPFSAVAYDKITGAPIDKTNRTETIAAKVAGTSATAQITIQVIGSKLALTPAQNIAQVGQAISLTAVARDAAAIGVNAQPIRFSIASSSTGSGTLSAATATTGSNGSTQVTLTGTAPGNVVVNADWLNAAGVSTLTSSTTVNITSVGVSFEVTSPTSNPTSLTLAASQQISVTVPTAISGSTVANVRFATTLGSWANGSKASTVVPVANAVTETLTAGANSGNANIQIDALDASGNVLATLNRIFALSSVTAAKISLQPSVSTVAPSTGGSTNSATLTATVRDASNNSVGNAPVLFEIVNPTGSGEQISPVVVYSDSSGQAVATFTSGALPTVGGLQVKATVVGTAVSDVKTINVAGTSVSVTVGQANVVSSTNDSTTYQLPMSVLVVSSTGAVVSGATVTLSAFPTHYYRGSRDGKCIPVYTRAAVSIPGKVTAGSTYAFPNEDVNENDILEAGEDYDPIGDGRGVGSITPPHAAAGTLPPTVVTDKNGVGTFNLIYLKNYANWIDSRVRAKVVVNGTEFVNELDFNLVGSSVDTTPVCTLPNSPFGL